MAEAVKKSPGPTARARRAKAAQRARAYRKVCAEVDERDGGTCRHCGTLGPDGEVHHHHIQNRSLGGDDSTSNLICVCRMCHYFIHMKKLGILGTDANGPLDFRRV